MVMWDIVKFKNMPNFICCKISLCIEQYHGELKCSWSNRSLVKKVKGKWKNVMYGENNALSVIMLHQIFSRSDFLVHILEY